MNYKKGSVGMWVLGVLVVVGSLFYFVGGDNMKSMSQTGDTVLREDEKVMMKDNMKDTSMKKDEMMKKDEVMEQNGDTSMVKKDSSVEAMSVKAGFYEVYSTESFSQFMRSWSGDTKVVLFFSASWCPSCQALHKELLGYSLPAGVAVFSVDYDKFPELKKKYGVTYQHTLVQVDANSGLIKKWSGGDVAKIISEVK